MRLRADPSLRPRPQSPPYSFPVYSCSLHLGVSPSVLLWPSFPPLDPVNVGSIGLTPLRFAQQDLSTFVLLPCLSRHPAGSTHTAPRFFFVVGVIFRASVIFRACSQGIFGSCFGPFISPPAVGHLPFPVPPLPHPPISPWPTPMSNPLSCLRTMNAVRYDSRVYAECSRLDPIRCARFVFAFPPRSSSPWCTSAFRPVDPLSLPSRPSVLSRSREFSWLGLFFVTCPFPPSYLFIDPIPVAACFTTLFCPRASQSGPGDKPLRPLNPCTLVCSDRRCPVLCPLPLADDPRQFSWSVR